MDSSTDEKTRILQEIRDGVRLIAAAMAEPLRKRLHAEFLTSSQRVKMYQEFNGARSYDEIAKRVGTSSEAVRQLAVTLDEAGLVVLSKNGSKTCPRKIL